MNELISEVEKIAAQMQRELENAGSVKDIEGIKVKFLGREGCLTALMKRLKGLDLDAKKEVGPVFNRVRKEAEAGLRRAKEKLERREAEKLNEREKWFDVTISSCDSGLTGTRHIYSTFLEEIEDIFISMGFSVFDGPEVEKDFYNFGALNIPEDHPARDMQDTLWLEGGENLLRTHTSNVQIHAMQKYGAPIAGIAPGRVFRRDETDATHDVMFTQCEGILVDKGISLSHLLGTVNVFLKRIFRSEDVKIRTRPGFFPFVEPGLEVDMSCVFCKDGCSVCKKTGWIELMGAGLVHPNVLKAVEIDPEVYSGFAFGFGVERLAMLRYGINDVRLFHSGKLKFLEQF
ncbi:phenylalanine--tRNA ligase subunit alpha [Candidatus Dependentiae bacterium]